MSLHKHILSILLVGVFFAYGCKKILDGNDGIPRNPNLPYVTNNVDSTNDSSATVTITVKNGGSNPAIRLQGLCWSTSPNPTIKSGNIILYTQPALKWDSVLNKFDSSIATTFTITIKGFSPKTTYYVRGFANNQNDSSGLSYADQLIITTPASSPYSIGQYYGGGYIFYIDTSTGLHGLVCDTTDLSDSIPWSITNNTKASVVSATAIGFGFNNTFIIDSLFHDSIPIAASVCSSYNGSGYTDWFLPTKDELNLMYNNLVLRGYGNFSPANYWSSSDYLFDGKTYAWAQYFVNGNQYYFRQTLPLYVRAVRKF